MSFLVYTHKHIFTPQICWCHTMVETLGGTTANGEKRGVPVETTGGCFRMWYSASAKERPSFWVKVYYAGMFAAMSLHYPSLEAFAIGNKNSKKNEKLEIEVARDLKKAFDLFRKGAIERDTSRSGIKIVKYSTFVKHVHLCRTIFTRSFHHFGKKAATAVNMCRVFKDCRTEQAIHSIVDKDWPKKASKVFGVGRKVDLQEETFEGEKEYNMRVRTSVEKETAGKIDGSTDAIRNVSTAVARVAVASEEGSDEVTEDESEDEEGQEDSQDEGPGDGVFAALYGGEDSKSDGEYQPPFDETLRTLHKNFKNTPRPKTKTKVKLARRTRNRQKIDVPMVPGEDGEKEPLIAPLDRLDASVLYNGETDQYMVFERMSPGCTGGSGEDFLPENGKGVKECVLVELGKGQMAYLVADAHSTYHGQVSREKATKVIDTCELNHISYRKLYNNHSHVSHSGSGMTDFISVLHGKTYEYEDIFGDVRIDAKGLVMILLGLKEKGSMSISCSSSSSTTTNEERGTMHVNCGFGAQAYDHYVAAAERDTVLTQPEMINNNEDCRPIYEAVGDVLDCLTDAADSYCQYQGQKPMYDGFRHERFGKKLADKCKARRSRFDAFTVALSVVGTEEEVAGSNAGEGGKDAEYKVKRHTDGPNDFARGYNYTGVWSAHVIIDGKIYRLVIIAYTRRSVGVLVAKELGYAGKVERALEKYDNEVLNGEKYKNFSLFPGNSGGVVWYTSDATGMLDRAAMKSGEDDDAGSTFQLHCAFVNRNSFHSSFLHLFHELVHQYDLSRSSKVQLLYIICQQNSQSKFHFVCGTWLKSDRRYSPLVVEGETMENLVTRYLKDCLGLGCLSACGGDYPRCTPFATRWPAGQQLETALERLDTFLVRANNETDPRSILDDMISSQEESRGLFNIGPFASIGFYPFAVMAGLVTTEVGKRNALFGRMTPEKNYVKTLSEMGCDTPAKQQSLLKAVSQRRLENLCHTENALCEVYRKNRQYDLFFHGQGLYNIVDRGSDGVVVLWKKFGHMEWENVIFDGPCCMTATRKT
jgi:hypothetical protein